MSPDPEVVAARRRAIARFRGALTARPWSGYDVVVVSSSTPEEAAVRQQVLEAAFRGVETGNPATGGSVCVLSVCDESQGGQVIGQVVTWVRAREAFRAYAASRGLAEGDLDRLAESGAVRVAVYHNGGKGERASPATQSLGNSRGSQKLVGTVMTAAGTSLELDLVLAVVLQTLAYAPPRGASAAEGAGTIDTWWGNQLVFGARDPGAIATPPTAIAKFLVAIDRDHPDEKDLYDYGTARLDADGRIAGFLANKKLARPCPGGGYEPNPEYAEVRRALWEAPGAAYDFGSFRMTLAMHFALVEYWGEFKGMMDAVATAGRASCARDIDPALVQLLVPLADALDVLEARAGLAAYAPLPRPADLRRAVRARDRSGLAAARAALAAALGAEPIRALAQAAGGKTEYVEETLEFFLLYRDVDRIFGPGWRRVGALDLGAGSHWFAYKRLMDIGNEKFLMLGDLAAAPFAIEPSGLVERAPISAGACRVAEDARAFRGIDEDAVAIFRTGRRGFRLSSAQVRSGVSIVDGEVRDGDVPGAAVYVRGSVVQGGTVLHPGSRIVESVVNGSEGRIEAENSYVEGTLAAHAVAAASVLHRVVDAGVVRAAAELVSDVFRPAIRTPGLPAGQARLRVPVGYDPKDDAATRDEGGAHTFREIREMPCAKAANDRIEAAIRARVREAVEASGAGGVAPKGGGGERA